MKKNIMARVLFGIGIVLLISYVGGLVYFNYFAHYSPYASAGANVDSFIHTVLFLPASILCLLLSIILHMKSISE